MQDRNIVVKAYIAGVVFACFTGFSYFAVKVGLSTAGPLEQMTYRYFFASVGVILVYLLYGRRKGWTIKPNGSVIMIAAFYVAFLGIQSWGLVYCTSVVSSILFACCPILIAVLGWLVLKEPLRAIQWFGILIGSGAVLYVAYAGQGDVSFSGFGLLLLIISVSCLTVYSLLLRSERGKTEPFQIAFYCAVFGEAVLLILMIVKYCLAGDLMGMFGPANDVKFIMSTMYLGICCIVATALLMAFVSVHLPAAQAGVFNNIATVISIAAGVLLLGEPIYLYHVICAVFIIGGVVFVNFGTGKARKEGS